jgi:hypothetical protein
MRGAGGTQGGIGQFFIGLAMMVGGGYLLLNAIDVTQHFSLSYPLYTFRSFRFTSGMTLIPLIFGIGCIFYNYKNVIGWLLTAAALIMLGFGIMTSLEFHLQNMSAFELIMLLILCVGGIGLFLSSFKSYD